MKAKTSSKAQSSPAAQSMKVAPAALREAGKGEKTASGPGFDPFVHLHVHSEYSFLDGLGHPADFVTRAKELGQTAIAITDHGNVSAHKRWFDACQQGGIKAILGVEAYVCEDASKKDRKLHHITLLAKDLVGYRNLLKLTSAAWQDGFYYKPRTDWDMLKQYSKGVIATSGCPGGRLGHGVAREGWDQSKVIAELRRQANIFEDYYVEFSPWQYKEGVNYAGQLYAAMVKEGLKPVLTMDAHYPRPEDAQVQDVMLCIQNNCQFNDPDRMKFTQDDFCLHSGNDMAAKWYAIHGKGLPVLDDMILNTRRIADSTNLDFPKATPLSFKHKGDKKALLRKLCEDGMKAKKFGSNPAYRDRLEYEFNLVCTKDFVDYFLVVADLIVWAKDRGILVGPARGSSCGSLMCFLLRITEIDPLVHGLMMERFIDVTRADLPDIDIDFDAERRHEVKTYLETTYGADRVANLATFSTFKGKMCLQDIGRVFSYKIPVEAVNECKRLIVERSSADSRHGFTIEDTFTDFEQAAEHLKSYPELGMARRLEGQVRQLGVHAAGTVISNEPIGNFAAIYVTPIKKDRVISMDYHDAVSVGLLKIDLLGLTALTAMKRAIAMAEQNHGVKININDISLEDPQVYENFQKQRLHGIFQFEGEATRQVCREVKPVKFEDLVAINALSRPGPLHSGGTSSFIARRRGQESSAPLHPLIEDITKSTYGITVYQEQVMQVVRIMGKFDWSGIATVRKMMSKKYGDEAFEAMRARFVEGAVSQGASDKDANAVWENINTFGAWAFNKCITGDTLVENASPNQFAKKFLTVEELFNNSGYATSNWSEQPENYKRVNLLGMDVDGRIRPSRVKQVFYKGVNLVTRITTESGKAITATANHRLLGRNGFKEVRDFSVGEAIGVSGGTEPLPYKPSGDNGKGWRKGRTGGAGDFLDKRIKEVKDFRKARITAGSCCEHCEQPHRRMEVHHVTRNPPNSILEWLCPGCHKKVEYKQGRTKVWQKGIPVVYEKIKSIKIIGTSKVYDIEMEDESRPTFIANGFVSHNSHSVAYSVMAYQLMWLKTYYPSEFYAGVIGSDSDKDKQRRVIKEFINSGGKLLPVCVNDSKTEIGCNADGLRLGFDVVKGLGSKSETIVKAQPYKNLIDFRRRSGLSKANVDRLLKIGAFRELCFAHTQEQGDLFGADQAVTEEQDYRNPKKEDVAELCPLAVVGDLTREWRVWVHRHCRSKVLEIAELGNIKTKTDVNIIALTNPKTGFTLKNKMGGHEFQAKPGEEGWTKEQYNFINFDADDESGDVVVRVSYKVYPRFKEMLWKIRPDEPLIIQGMVTGVMQMVFAFNIIKLKELRDKVEGGYELTKQERELVSGIKPQQRFKGQTFQRY